MRENIRKFMLLTILYGLMASSGCKLDVPEGENPTFYLLKKAWPGKPTMDRKELLVSLASEDADLRRHGVMMFGNKKYAEFETTPELLANVALTVCNQATESYPRKHPSSLHRTRRLQNPNQGDPNYELPHVSCPQSGTKTAQRAFRSVCYRSLLLLRSQVGSQCQLRIDGSRVGNMIHMRVFEA